MKHIKIVESSFERFGKFVYDNKWKLVIVSFLINGIFGLGLLSLTLNNDIKALFLNRHTETKKLEEKLLTMYPDKSMEQFKAYSSIKLPLFVDVIVSAKSKENLFDAFFINQTHKLIDEIKNISIVSDYLGLIYYTDLCARNSGNCVMEGSEILQELGQCKNKSLCLNMNNLNSSFTKERFSSILNSIGEYTLINGTIVSARYVKFRLYLRQDTKGVSHDAKHWQNNFVKYMSSFKNAYLEVEFSHSTSLFEEIGQDTYPDIRFFALTFTILLIYLGFYISGGDCVSKRMNIGRMGTIVVPLSILGAWGLVTGAGLEFTNCVGVMPYFALFYEANNMLITLNGVKGYNEDTKARDRISAALRTSGIPITITTITYVTAFAVGTRSGYLVMKLFSIYTATTLLFIYINHMVFFTACLAIHEQRIDANRHFCGCNVVKPKKEIPLSRSCCFRCCCSGDKPTSQNGTASRMELLTQKFLSYFVLRPYIKWPMLILFTVYTGISTWQITHYEVGIFKPDYVTRNSYFRTFNELNTRVFTSNFYVSFIIPGHILYQDKASMNNVFSVAENTANNYIDQSSTVSWFNEYEKKYSSTLPPNTTFIDSIKLFIKANSEYQNDVEFDRNGTIVSTRIYLKTHNMRFPNDIHFLKENFLANGAITDKESDLDRNIIQSKIDKRNYTSSSHKISNSKTITLYAPLFVYTDEWNRPLTESLILIMTLVVVNAILTTLFCPHPLSAVAVVVSMVSNILGLFGFMSLFKVEMTPFSMIVIVLGACYTVDVITQTMYSFFNIIGIDRKSRTFELLSTTSVALFNTTLASFIGQLVLFVEKSYVFLTVMKIIMTITAISFIHSAFIIPIVLSMVGQKNHKHNLAPDSIKTIVIPQLPCDSAGKQNDTEFIGDDLQSNGSYFGSDNMAYEL